jgi:hypothetical protein
MPDESSPDSQRVIVMCMHCRRTLRNSPEGEKWELIEQFILKRPANVSDGLCADCLRENYPGK